MINSFLLAFSTYNFFFAMRIVFFMLMVLLSIAITVIVLLQKGTDNNLGAISGSTDSFFGKNKSSSVDAKLKRATIGVAVSIFVCSILYFVIEILRIAFV